MESSSGGLDCIEPGHRHAFRPRSSGTNARSIAPRPRSALLRAIKDRLDVDDRRAVESLEVPDLEPRGARDLDDPHAVNPDRVGPVRRPGTEHAAHWGAPVVPRMYAQRFAITAVQPRQHQDLLPFPQVP